MSKIKGLYSAVDKAAKELARTKGTGKEFMVEVAKTKGVKPTEIQTRGLQKIADLPKMSKDEFIKELEKSPAPQVEESRFSTDPSQQSYSHAYFGAVGHLPADQQFKAWSNIPLAERKRLVKEAETKYPYREGTKYEEYATPNGGNYREILLRLPARKSELQDQAMYLEAIQRRRPLTEAENAQLANLHAEIQNNPEYRSAHWDQPNVLAHIRASDREGPNGKRILHIEEIQSDWHQEGRKKGYKGDYETESEMLKKRDDLYDARTELVKQAIAIEQKGEVAPQELIDRIHKMNDDLRLIEERKDQARSAVPDAPFKKNWHELAMKRMLNYAVEHGYDSIAITPGAEHAKRYDLSKQVNEISWNPTSENRNLLTIDTGDRKITASYDPSTGQFPKFESGNFEGKTLDEVVGKEMAQKILGEKSGSLSGEGLTLGGEGMKGFYDKMLPDYLNAYGKKYGAQVNLHGYVEPINKGGLERNAEGQYVEFPPETIQLHSFDITPEMRQDISSQGLPMFADGGVVKAAVGGEYNTDPDMQDGGNVIQGTVFKKGGRVNVSKNPDTMLLDLMSKN